MDVTFPSASVPAFPAVSVQAPDGWSVVFSSPSTFAVVDQSVPEGAFRANVVVTIVRDAPGVELDDAGSAIDTFVDSRRGFTPVSDERIDRDGRTWLRKAFEILGPSGTPDLRYIVATTIVDRGVCSDSVRITATCKHESEEARARLAAAVDSATVTVEAAA